MKTRHGIPQDQLDEIVIRDNVCVYCKKTMLDPYNNSNHGDSATIEHLNHRADWDSVKDFVDRGESVSSIIAICCGSCNSSRSDLPLLKWFETQYCKDHKIKVGTVSTVVRVYVQKYEK